MQTTDIPNTMLQKWQDIIDLIVRLAGVPVGLIMRVRDDMIEVLVASHGADNPYTVGAAEHVIGSGLYCETVIKTQNKLLVSNALTSPQWCRNPDLKLGLLSYLGFPIRLPNGQPLGTICVLDNKENAYSTDIELLIAKMRDLIEYELHLMDENRRQRLFAQESILRRILDGVPTALVCCNSADQPQILYLNQQFVRQFGYTPAELHTVDQWLQLACLDWYERMTRGQWWQTILARLRQQPGCIEQEELSVQNKQGGAIVAVMHMVVIDDLLLLALIDMTEHQQRLQTLQRAYAELRIVNAELHRLATTHPLTGSAHRRQFEDV